MITRRLILAVGLLIAIIVLASWLVVTRRQLEAHPLVLQQFAHADRVILGSGSPPVVTVTGDKAREIVHLITTARRITDASGRPQPIGILLLNEVQFYQGTNYLGMIRTSHELFSAGGVDGYEADREKMKSLVDEPLDKARATPPNTALEPTPTRP